MRVCMYKLLRIYYHLQELTNERDDLQSKVSTLEDEVTMRGQQLQECQQRIEELSQHKAAVNELQHQIESFNKLVNQ